MKPNSQRAGQDLEAMTAANNTKLDLRKSHFNLGNEPILKESSAKMAFKEVDTANSKVSDTSDIRNKM